MRIVILFNFSKKNVNITKGERIAQLIVEKIVPTFVKEIGIEEELPITIGEKMVLDQQKIKKKTIII